MTNFIPPHHARKQRNIGTKVTNRQKKILAPSAKGIPTKAGKLYRPAMQTSIFGVHLTTTKKKERKKKDYSSYLKAWHKHTFCEGIGMKIHEHLMKMTTFCLGDILVYKVFYGMHWKLCLT